MPPDELASLGEYLESKTPPLTSGKKHPCAYCDEATPHRLFFAILPKDEADLARKAYYGGRTDISNTLVELADEQLLMGWHIKYLDFVSL